MKNKKIIFAFMAAIILILLICIPLVIKINKNVKFQSKEEMSEVIDGTWKTGDGDYDFIFTVDNDSAYLSNGDKSDNPSKIVLVPDKGYFYYEKNGDTKEIQI
ncbi:hypothetical protein [Roseburia intestinalis]